MGISPIRCCLCATVLSLSLSASEGDLPQRRPYGYWNDPCTWELLRTGFDMGVCALGHDLSKCISAYRSIIRSGCPDKPFLSFNRAPR